MQGAEVRISDVARASVPPNEGAVIPNSRGFRIVNLAYYLVESCISMAYVAEMSAPCSASVKLIKAHKVRGWILICHIAILTTFMNIGVPRYRYLFFFFSFINRPGWLQLDTAAEI